MIQGVVIQNLRQIPDERGRVMHMLRSDNPIFDKFGEVYFSEVLPNVVKGWKRHKLMAQNFAVPVGLIKLVIYDDRPHSETNGLVQVVELGRDEYKLVRVPSGLWYGFQCVSDIPSLLVNCANMPHDPGESEAKDINDSCIPFNW